MTSMKAMLVAFGSKSGRKSISSGRTNESSTASVVAAVVDGSVSRVVPSFR